MLKQRLMIAIPLLIITLISFFLPSWGGALAFLLLILAFQICGLWEFSKISRKIGLTAQTEVVLPLGISQVLVVFTVCWLYPGKILYPLLVNILFIGLLIAEIFYSLCKKQLSKGATLDAFYAIGSYCYICLPVSLIIHLFFFDGINGMGARFLLLFMLLSIRFGDTGGYTLGSISNALMKNGNHKISPIISPKKSLEGIIGSVIFTILFSLVCWFFFSEYVILGQVKILAYIGWIGCIAWGIISSLLGLLGDLAESVFKRVADVKDSGNIPGLGGVLDLADSVLIMVPFFYVIVILITQVKC